MTPEQLFYLIVFILVVSVVAMAVLWAVSTGPAAGTQISWLDMLASWFSK